MQPLDPTFCTPRFLSHALAWARRLPKRELIARVLLVSAVGLLVAAGLASRLHTLEWSIALGSFGILLLALLVPYAARQHRHREERKPARRARESSEARFLDIASSVPDWIWEADASGHFRYSNRSVQRILGYAPETLEGQSLLHLLLPEDRASVRQALEGSTRSLTPIRNLLSRAVATDDRVVWLELSAAPTSADQSGRVGFRGVIRDVTERKQLEGQLLRAQRLATAGHIAGQVAHDFNNLLAPLAGYPELIKLQLPPEHPARAYCDLMLSAAQRMAEINQDLIILGHRGHVEHEVLNLNRVVTDVLDQLDPPPALGIQRELAADLLSVQGSAAQLRRVVSNLLTNAREAMEDHGVLTVRTTNIYLEEPTVRYTRVGVGEYVRLDVVDTGDGIPADARDRIFDVFFTTKLAERRRGSGLGLSVVQSIVENHGGYVDVQSEEGRGATFSAYLPVSREAILQAPPTPLVGGSEQVLIVDDDAGQRQVVTQMLSALGYGVRLASSGEEALAELRDQPADLLLLDMIMPNGIDGAETFRRARQLHSDQRAIIVSGYAESDRVDEALALGADGFIPKPVTLDRLAHAIRHALDHPD